MSLHRDANGARPVRRRQRGFTLIEMMISMVLTSLIMAIAVPFFKAQGRLMSRSSGRFEASQNLSFAVNAVDLDTRAGGTNLAAGQPLVVQAAANALTLNADLVSRIGTTLGAIYFDSTADSAMTRSMLIAEQRVLPNATSSWIYPVRNYGGSAETISYWLTADTVSGTAGEFMLMRRVNNSAPRMIARSILLPTGQPAFRYFKADSVGRLTEIATSALPIRHSTPRHDSTHNAESLRIDSIRVVRVRFTGVFRDPRAGDVQRTLERTIRVNNSYTTKIASCGAAPDAPGTPLATSVPGGTAEVTITWSPSSDENGGPRDVEMYSVYRRLASASLFPDDPIATMPAGSLTYSYVDNNVLIGQQFVYAVAAMDCGRSISARASSASVTVQ